MNDERRPTIGSREVGPRSAERSRDRLDPLQPGSEATHRIAVPLQLAVRQIANSQVGDAAKRGPRELSADFLFAIVGRDEKEPACRVSGCAERKVEQSDDPRIDGRRVLDLERGRDARLAAVEPQRAMRASTRAVTGSSWPQARTRSAWKASIAEGRVLRRAQRRAQLAMPQPHGHEPPLFPAAPAAPAIPGMPAIPAIPDIPGMLAIGDAAGAAGAARFMAKAPPVTASRADASIVEKSSCRVVVVGLDMRAAGAPGMPATAVSSFNELRVRLRGIEGRARLPAAT